MLKECVIFHNEKELQELTGLDSEELWRNYFNTDDFDGGIRVKREDCLWGSDLDCAKGIDEDDPICQGSWGDLTQGDESFIIELLIEHALYGYCVGYDIVFYGDYAYYLIHHA